MRVFRGRGSIVIAAGIVVATTTGCSRGREYELRGQVLAVDRARQEITVKHEDIQGFMPGMTMPFRVRDAAAVDARKPGDLIHATLVVEDESAYLKNIRATGHAMLTEPPPTHPRFDVLAAGEVVPDTTLVDAEGVSRRLSDWRGKAVALTFIYTRCPVPNFCPLMDRHFGEVQRAIASDPVLRDRAHLLSISFDPAHDTPAVLHAHAAKAGANPDTWTFLTGEPRDVEALGARFGVSIVPDEASAPEIVHNLRTAVIDAQGQLVQILNGNEWTPRDLIEALRRASGTR
jgi:protein SCO1/2